MNMCTFKPVKGNVTIRINTRGLTTDECDTLMSLLKLSKLNYLNWKMSAKIVDNA